jgi:hypothetical protein
MLTQITFERHDGLIETRVFKGNDWVHYLIKNGYKQIHIESK